MTITAQPLGISDLDDRDRDCLRALYETAGDYDGQRLRHGLPIDGTGRWATEDGGFTAWEESDDSRLLWLTANPACGKSVFTNGYVKKVQEERPSVLVYSYFFNRNGAHQALSALLHQILADHPGAASHTRDEFATKGPSFTASTRALWKMTHDICRKFIPANTEVLLVLEALDECDEPSRSTLVEEILLGLSDDGETELPRLKILVTSRPTPDLELAFRSPRTITRVRGEDQEEILREEIDRVISHRVGQLGSRKLLKRDNGRRLRWSLVSKADRSFLFVDAVFNLLTERGSYSASGIESAIKDAEQCLNGLYELALPAMTREAVDLFQCLLAIHKRPTLSSINVALALRAEETSIEDLENELEPDIEYTVKRLGGFLVRISNGTVDFVHDTARNFLRKRSCDNVLGEATCHFTMADRCLRFLTAMGESIQVDSVAGPLAEPPFKDFYRYATQNWNDHTVEAGVHHGIDASRNESPEILKLQDSISVLCDPTRGFLASWWPYFASDHDEGKEKDLGTFAKEGSAWYFTTCEGLISTREYLLHRAASMGNQTILDSLLASAPGQLSVTEKNDEDEDVLCVAVRKQNRDIVSWILNNFADAPLRREAGLAIALEQDDMFTVLTLLHPESKLVRSQMTVWPRVPRSTEDLGPETMQLLSRNLSFACLWGRWKLVAELLKDGVDVNTKSGGMSPLVAAVFSGHMPLVQSLLNRGADPDELSAPEPGSLDTESVATLQDLGVEDRGLTQDNIDLFWKLTWRYLSAGAFGITPLAAAAQSNQVGIANLLQKRGLMDNTVALAIRRAFPNCGVNTRPSARVCEITSRNLSSLKDSHALGLRICHEVVSNGPVEALEELIAYGCLELPPDGRRWTLLHVAAGSGNAESIEVLLREATHNMRWSKDVNQLTCLRVALREGHGDVARRIHAADGELATATVERRTMLHDASYGGIRTGPKVIEDVLSLIVSGALPIHVSGTVDSRDPQGHTALHHVILATSQWVPPSPDAKCYAADAVRALVIGGAEYNLVDNQELTPLAFASQAVAQANSADPPIDARVLAALVELETTLRRVPFWGDNRLDAGAIRGNYEELLRDMDSKVDLDDSDDWMFDSEEDLDDDGDDEEIEEEE